MIVIEGPDGAGKSTLAEVLSVKFNLPMHERASDSVAGPVDNLFKWAYDDVVSMPDREISVYDRHPLLSEYVYGPIVRSTLPEGFTTTTAHRLIRMMAASVLVVLCRPPSERLRSSVSDQRDMPGVSTHIERIAAAYDALKMFWPGQIVTHDFTSADSLPNVISMCRIYVAAKQSKKIHPSTGRYA